MRGKKSLTTGFMENITLSGEDGAAGYEHKLEVLEILGDSTIDNIESGIDFWMTNRASDNETFLAKMGIDR